MLTPLCRLGLDGHTLLLCKGSCEENTQTYKPVLFDKLFHMCRIGNHAFNFSSIYYGLIERVNPLPNKADIQMFYNGHDNHVVPYTTVYFHINCNFKTS